MLFFVVEQGEGRGKEEGQMGNRAGEDHFSLLFSVYCTNDEGMALSFSWFLVKFQDFFFFLKDF